MGTPQSPLGSPFTVDERIKIIRCMEQLIQSHDQNIRENAEDAFQNARLAMYEDFVSVYLANNTSFPPNYKYHDCVQELWGRKIPVILPRIPLFEGLRTEWDITTLGYLFELLRGLRVSIEGGKVKLGMEKGGRFRALTGAVFTPYNICEMMAERAFQLFANSESDTPTIPNVLDPASGGGAFLIAAARALKRRYSIVELKEIIVHHLFGIDIDPEAIFITILSLWCLIGDPELDLNALEPNIVVGNTLLAKSAPVELHPLVWEEIFPNVWKAGGFDIVIGNPPYVRQERIREMKSYLEHYESFSPTADLYVYFFEKSIDLLKPGGILSFITSNSFLRTHSARPLRAFLKENIRITDFFDAFKGPVFAAGVTPCILTLQRVPPSGTIRINEAHEMPQANLEDRAWNFVPTKYHQLLAKMDKYQNTLVKYCAVYFCIKPGRVEDFVLSLPQISRLNLEESLFQPVLRGSDVKRYLPLVPRVSILFPYKEPAFERLDWKVIEHNFPKIHDYLLERRESLEARDDYRRNKDHMQWYELRPCNYYAEFRQPKILTPDICHTNSFTLDQNGYLCLDTVFMIRAKDTTFPHEFWVGYLNSRPVEFFLKMTSSSLGTKGFRYKKQFLEQIPVPTFVRSQIDQIAKFSRENLYAQNSGRQGEIDEIIFQAFNFSAEGVQAIADFLEINGKK